MSSPIRSIADWRHTHSFADVEGGTLITDDIHTRAPSGPLKSFLAYRQHQLLGDLSFLSRIAALVDAPPLTVGVTGSRSLIGRAVTAQLRTAGHTVVQIVREKMRPGRRLWEPFHPAQDLLDGIDVVVHLAGEPMLGRFNDDHKKAIRDSRVVPTRKLAELAASSVHGIHLRVSHWVVRPAHGRGGGDRGVGTRRGFPGGGYPGMGGGLHPGR